MRLSITVRALALAPLVFAAQPARAANEPTSAMDGRWHFTVAPYMWFSGISGEASVANLVSVPVDASISDILSNFDFGLQGHFQARRNRFGFILDASWSNLGVPVAPGAAVQDFTVDVRQVFAEGLVFYRVAQGSRADNPAHLEVLLGARFTGTKTGLTAETPAGVGREGDSQELSWVDALAGAQFRAPLGSRLAVMGRADVAGFGSHLTWNVEGDLAFLASQHWTFGAGWRHMDIDYEEGEGLAQKQFDLAYDGPRVWFAYSW